MITSQGDSPGRGVIAYEPGVFDLKFPPAGASGTTDLSAIEVGQRIGPDTVVAVIIGGAEARYCCVGVG